MSVDEQLANLRLYLDEHRGHLPAATLIDQWLQELIETPRSRNLTPELLYALSKQRGMWQDGQFLTPQPLAEFIARIAEHYKPSSILDPTCGSGLLLHAVATSVNAGVIHGIDIGTRFVERARSVLGNQAEIVCGDALEPQDGILDAYDLIVADPPLGMRVKRQQQVPSIGTKFAGEVGHALTVWAVNHLTERGVALIIVSPAFLWSNQASRVHQSIADSGGYIRALIHLPGGSLNFTGIDSYLAVLERGNQGKVFVGQYIDNPDHQMQLIANLKSRKSGPVPGLGRLCPLETFKGFETLESRERVSRLAKSAGWPGLPADDVIAAHSILGRKESAQLDHGPTSCYVRLLGRPLAVLDPAEFPASWSQRFGNVLHLHLAPDYADPRFMVHWINSSQIGNATISSVTRGGSNPRIDVPSLLESKFYLPSIEDQVRAIEGASDLTRIRATADELEAALWDGTGDIAKIVDEIAVINQQNRYEDWLETLPFPMASILWRHHADGGSSRERYKVLLQFFEATAAFLATVHLSAFMVSDDLWNEHGSRLSRDLKNSGLSLDLATFGSWRYVAEYLSSVSGKLIKDPGKAELWQRIYGTPNQRVLSMLCNPDLRSTLQHANMLRNSWDGHTGATGESQAHQYEVELDKLVHELRGIFGRTWLGYELIQPMYSRYKRGIYHYTARRLMGTRSAPFVEIEVESKFPLENDSLYLFDKTNLTGMPLQPFVLVMPAPEKRANACFVFSRRESAGARFVSYHFEEESEIRDSFPGIDEALARIHAFDEDPIP